MGSLTGLLFAALCIYGGGWYMGSPTTKGCGWRTKSIKSGVRIC